MGSAPIQRQDILDEFAVAGALLVHILILDALYLPVVL